MAMQPKPQADRRHESVFLKIKTLKSAKSRIVPPECTDILWSFPYNAANSR